MTQSLCVILVNRLVKNSVHDELFGKYTVCFLEAACLQTRWLSYPVEVVRLKMSVKLTSCERRVSMDTLRAHPGCGTPLNTPRMFAEEERRSLSYCLTQPTLRLVQIQGFKPSE